ncbi:unnamed protein product, partial [Didymodactylos carnosus]
KGPLTEATMEGKLKEKLESLGLACLCLATGYETPFSHWCKKFLFLETIIDYFNKLAYASLILKLAVRKKLQRDLTFSTSITTPVLPIDNLVRVVANIQEKQNKIETNQAASQNGTNRTVPSSENNSFNILPPLHHGKEDENVVTWLFQIEELYYAKKVIGDGQLYYSSALSPDAALQWYHNERKEIDDCIKQPILGFLEFKQRIRVAFEPPHHQQLLRRQLRMLKKTTIYIYEFGDILGQIDAMVEADKIAYFIDGLRERTKAKDEVQENEVINELKKHIVDNLSLDFALDGYRLKDNRQLFLFVKDRDSFIILFDEKNWPPNLCSKGYEKSQPRRLPPQFSLVIRNVTLDTQDNELLNDLQKDFLDIINLHRFINKNNLPKTMARLGVKSIKTMDDLVKRKHITINSIRYPVSEYFAPAKVLVCSKCFELGHFRSNCKYEKDNCRTCGLECKNIHHSTDLRCPTIKTFRTELTKSLLSSSTHNNNKQQQRQQGFVRQNGIKEFPPLNVNTTQNTWGWRANDEVYNRLNQLDLDVMDISDQLEYLLDINKKQFAQQKQTTELITSHAVLIHQNSQKLMSEQVQVTFLGETIENFLMPIYQTVLQVLPKLIQQESIPTASIESLAQRFDYHINAFSEWKLQYREMGKEKLEKLSQLVSYVNECTKL